VSINAVEVNPGSHVVNGTARVTVVSSIVEMEALCFYTHAVHVLTIAECRIGFTCAGTTL
jgi:hypothetical protein